jgi:predicted RND superfamily exporter protein
MDVVGPAISIDALAIALGFGVLAFSEVPANARLGLLAVACVAGAWLGAIALLPALVGGRRKTGGVPLPGR